MDDLNARVEPTTPGALANLRDVAVSSDALKPGILLRSDAPASGDAPPVEAWWPPATVIDLRDQREKAEAHPLGGQAVVLDHPLFTRLHPVTSGASQWPARLAEVYVQMLADPLAPRLVAATTAIARAQAPVLVHCTAGKDRTGVTVAVALRLVGVSDEQIISDYALTGPAMPGVMARMKVTVRKAAGGTALAAVPSHVRSAAPEEMAEFLAALDGHDGGPAGWFTSHGGEVADIGRLQAMMRA